MEESVFSYAAKRIKPVMIIVSVIILLRGHNEPGGGFIGGLIASSGYILVAMATGPSDMLKRLWLDPTRVMALGLLLALLSALPAWFLAKDFFSGVWAEVPLLFGRSLKLGTPLVFDIGVYFTVIGFSLSIILNLMQVWKWK